MKNARESATADWYKKSFNQDYMRIYGHKDETAIQETNSILTYLGLPQTAASRQSPRILDVACGWGRHAIELARRGYTVTGVDLSSIMLDEAKKRAKKAEVTIRWLCMDLREMDFVNEFEVAINIFTSFGYFADEAENAKVLRNVFQSLVSGGRFLIDLDNPLYFIRKGQAVERFRLSGSPGVAEESVLKEEFLRWKRERHVTYSFLDRRGKEDDILLRCNLYDYLDIKSLLEQHAGFEMPQAAWGDFNGSVHPVPKLSEDLPRLIVIARKP